MHSARAECDLLTTHEGVSCTFFDCAKSTNDDNRQDFSHCEANVKSPLDGVLRGGSVSVGAELGLGSCRIGAGTLGRCLSVAIWLDGRAASQEAAFRSSFETELETTATAVRGARRSLE